MGTKADLAERDMRLRRTREAMKREGLSALLMAGRASDADIGRGYFRFFTDYYLWGHDGLVLIPLDGEPAVVMPEPALVDAIKEIGWINDARLDPYLAPTMAAIMKERGLTKGKVGIGGWKYIMPVASHETLKADLPGVEFVNGDNVLDRVRIRKSPLEIQQIRELWAVAKPAMERFAEVLEPGVTEVEAAGETLEALAAGGCRDMLVWINGQLPPKNVPVALDDVLECHVETPGDSGHWLELTIICAFRDPTPRELKMMDSELRALDEICRIAKPGVKVSEMSRTFERVLLEDGWQLASEQPRHNDFHGQGLDAVEWPVYGGLVKQDMVMEESMVFSYHPHRAVVPDVKFSWISDDILITADGAERLSGDWNLRWRMMK